MDRRRDDGCQRREDPFCVQPSVKEALGVLSAFWVEAGTPEVPPIEAASLRLGRDYGEDGGKRGDVGKQ